MICTHKRHSAAYAAMSFLAVSALAWSPAHAGIMLDAVPGSAFTDIGRESFGNVDQNEVPVAPGNNGNGSCVPAAVVNGWRYLENEYPGYGGLLVGEDLLKAAQELARLMGTTSNAGTLPRVFFSTKHRVMDERAPGKTEHKARTQDGPNEDWVEPGTPDFEFLQKWLRLRAALDLILEKVDPQPGEIPGHALNALGWIWKDSDRDGKVDPGEGTLIVVDPRFPDAADGEPGSQYPFYEDAIGRLFVEMDGHTWTVSGAYAQLPSPAGAFLFVIAMLQAGIARRDTRPRAASV